MPQNFWIFSTPPLFFTQAFKNVGAQEVTKNFLNMAETQIKEDFFLECPYDMCPP